MLVRLALVLAHKLMSEAACQLIAVQLAVWLLAWQLLHEFL